MAERTTAQSVASGLTILVAYPGCEIAVGYDVILAGPDLDVSEEDASELRQLGWFVDTEGSWARFV